MLGLWEACVSALVSNLDKKKFELKGPFQSFHVFVKMFWRKKLFSSGDHAYEVTKCFRFDSQRIVKGVRPGWPLLETITRWGFPCFSIFFRKLQFVPPWCRKAVVSEILHQIIQYSFHCLISLAFPHFHLKKILSIGSFTKIWRFVFVTFGPCYINNIPILKINNNDCHQSTTIFKEKTRFQS